ncbi:MAG: glycosyltransferase family 2 protein [Suilimivivens sp.]
MKLVTVIIPTYNRANMVCECIDSILKSTYSNLEVIVVDNCSTDRTLELLKERYTGEAQVRVLELKENLMAAGGRNEGIKKAQGDYLLFVDNDNIVSSDMIELLVKEMERDENVGLVGPLSINKYFGDTIWLASGDYHFFSSRPKTLYAGKKPEDITLEKKYSTCYSPNIMMVSKEVIEKVGGFDRSYFAMYEEADFGYRIKNAGYKEYIVTEARTYHMNYVGEGEQAKLRLLGIGFPERAFYYPKNRTVFMKKYAKWYHMISYYSVFIHVFTLYYSFVALKYGRKDIAKAWVGGTIEGIRTKVKKGVKVDIS